MNLSYDDIRLLSGSTHPNLAKRVAQELGIELVGLEERRFANGEMLPRVLENVRGHDVFFLSSLHARMDSILEAQLILECVKSSAGRITGIFPWIGHSKQDRRTKPREARSFMVVAKTLARSGLDRVMLFDLHNSTTSSFFGILDVPDDHTYLMRILIEEFKRRNPTNVVIGSPDISSVKRADAVSTIIGIPEEICFVRKIHDRETKELNLQKSKVFGDVEGKDVWFFDDMIQSFGTLEIAGQLVRKAGAKKIIAAAVHPDFTPAYQGKPSAIERLERSEFDEVIVVDTIPPRDGEIWPDKITVLDSAPFIAKCITLLHNNGQLSPLFLQY